MNAINLSEGSMIVINELFENYHFEFNKIIIKESFFGDLPTIELQIRSNDELPKINDKFTVKIQSIGGRVNEFNCFLYGILGDIDGLTLKFLCCDQVFTRNKSINKFTSIDDAITNLIGSMNRIDTVKTDLMEYQDPYYLHQLNQTNYQFCTKLCWSYKYNTIFGYVLDGLRFVDFNSSDMDNPVGTLIDRRDIKLESPANWSESKYFNESVEFIDYNTRDENIDENHILVNYYNRLIPVDSAYKELIGNYLFNTRLHSTKNVANFKTTMLLDYQVGDRIDIPSEQYNFEKFIITAREIQVVRSQPSISYTVQSI